MIAKAAPVIPGTSSTGLRIAACERCALVEIPVLSKEHAEICVAAGLHLTVLGGGMFAEPDLVRKYPGYVYHNDGEKQTMRAAILEAEILRHCWQEACGDLHATECAMELVDIPRIHLIGNSSRELSGLDLELAQIIGGSLDDNRLVWPAITETSTDLHKACALLVSHLRDMPHWERLLAVAYGRF